MIDVVGIMRFSVISANGAGFKTLNALSAAEIAATILDPVRIKKRLDLFRQIPLKSLQAQTDQRFKFVILISKSLDHEFKLQLHELQRENQFLLIEEVDQNDNWRAACARHVTAGSVSFRLDDDDAIHPMQVENLKRIANTVKPDAVISFPNGFYLGAKGKFILFQSRRWVVNAQGIAYFSDKKHRSIFDLGSHTKLDRYRMELCETPRAWMRLIHRGSDSGAQILKKAPITTMPPKFMKEFAPEFDFIDFEHVQSLLK